MSSNKKKLSQALILTFGNDVKEGGEGAMGRQVSRPSGCNVEEEEEEEGKPEA